MYSIVHQSLRIAWTTLATLNCLKSVYVYMEKINACRTDEHLKSYLATSNEYNRLSSDISHGKCSSHLQMDQLTETRSQSPHTNLIIDSVPLRDQHSVDSSTTTGTRYGREIPEGTIKFRQLVDGFIAHQCFTYKYNFIRVVNRNKLDHGI